MTQNEVATICNACIIAGMRYVVEGMRPCLMIFTADSSWHEPLVAHMCGPAPEGKVRLRLQNPNGGTS